MISCATLPKAGETDCGDQCRWWTTAHHLVLAVADGLGHGPEAAQASNLAMQCVAEGLNDALEDIFLRCDHQLRATRGVAMAVAVVHQGSGRVTLASVGNIRVVLTTATKDFRFGAARGIVGGGYACLTPEHFTLVPGNVLALFSDGLDEFTDLRSALGNPPDVSDSRTELLLGQWSQRKDDAALLLYRHEALGTPVLSAMAGA